MSTRALRLAAGIDPSNIVWIAAILAAILMVGIVAWILMRQFFSMNRGQTGQAGPIFPIDRLRQMRQNGTITEQEYKKLLEKISNPTENNPMVRDR